MKKSQQERVLARTLAEELKSIQAGSDDPVVVTGGVRPDITDKNNGDVPAN